MSAPVTRQTFDEVMVPNYAPAAFVPVKGEGSRLWDQQGKEYIDFASGIAVTSLGHLHPELTKVLHEQVDRLWHLSNTFTNEPALKLARRLTETTFAEKVFFCNSGAEANEAALKLARRYAFDHFGGSKTGIVSCKQAFHGRTLFTVSVGGQPKYTEGFAPLPGDLNHIEFNNLEAAEAAINAGTCAVIVEPVQGEGGVLPATKAYLQKLRELCDKHNALLIFDEVQIGVGRSGALYAYQAYGVTPDILTSAKALGNGFPVAAMLTSNKVAASFVVGTHGSTYGGNPLACVVADKVLELIDTPEVLDGVSKRHQLLKDGLAAINAKHGVFKEVRGMGLLIGAELQGAFHNKAKDIVNAAAKHGLMVLVAGTNVLRIVPSLVIPEADLKEGLARLDATIAELVTKAETAKQAQPA
ncbi:aspartate aminotransferase family protein [Vogesella fluminis]|uniref:Acetylornithine aminotransferase n=1 Tax=Vogesella fluminis TaxID=1069161 RepID=A0ABQ3HAG3_9NEIS|nr:aspartate aminotransferase family protein [Vogesella fluminis]GHD77646.1 acetylornithine/succinyldiaminopimelate aminotransferase [Vogesella fluminis]